MTTLAGELLLIIDSKSADAPVSTAPGQLKTDANNEYADNSLVTFAICTESNVVVPEVPT